MVAKKDVATQAIGTALGIILAIVVVAVAVGLWRMEQNWELEQSIARAEAERRAEWELEQQSIARAEAERRAEWELRWGSLEPGTKVVARSDEGNIFAWRDPPEADQEPEVRGGARGTVIEDPGEEDSRRGARTVKVAFPLADIIRPLKDHRDPLPVWVLRGSVVPVEPRPGSLPLGRPSTHPAF